MAKSVVAARRANNKKGPKVEKSLRPAGSGMSRSAGKSRGKGRDRDCP
jgi:hypothetical protein